MSKICLPIKDNAIIGEVMRRNTVAELIFFLYKLDIRDGYTYFLGTGVKET
jgi:hypothetical protein